MAIEIKNLQSWVEEAINAPEPLWLAEGTIPHAGLTIIAGRAKYGKKSWLAFLGACAMASGKALGPFAPSAPSKGLILCREGSEKFNAMRFKALEIGHRFSLDDLGDRLFMMHGGSFYMDDPAHVAELVELVKDYELQFVIIDTFARSFQGDENSSRDMMRALRMTEVLRDLGCAVILVHHLNKAAKFAPDGEPDADFGMRGSNALSGAYDSILSVQNLYIEEDDKIEQRSYLFSGGKNQEFVARTIEWGKVFGGGYAVKCELCDMPTVVDPRSKKR